MKTVKDSTVEFKKMDSLFLFTLVYQNIKSAIVDPPL